jgi:hypothetical protein
MFRCRVVVITIFVCVAHRCDDVSTPITDPPIRATWAAEPNGTQSGLSVTSRPLSVPRMSIKSLQNPNLPPELCPKTLKKVARAVGAFAFSLRDVVTQSPGAKKRCSSKDLSGVRSGYDESTTPQANVSRGG